MRLLPRRRPTIDKLKAAGDVEALRAMLDRGNPSSDGWHPDPDVRAQAAAALAQLDGEPVEQGLAYALSDPERSVRVAALDGMAARTTPIAVWRLLEAVANWPYVSEYAAIERAFSILVQWAPERAAEALARGLSHPAAAELDRRHYDALKALLAADPRGEDVATKHVADDLVSQLDSSDEEQATRAEQMLTWLGSAATDSVLAALDRDTPPTAAVRVAGELRDARAVEPLVALLGASDPLARAAAATALGDLNDTRAVQTLLGATQDPDEVVRDAASDALDAMGVAAVIVGVASVMRETIREQLAAGGTEGGEAEKEGLPEADPGNVLRPGTEVPRHPPTWAQEVLGRLLRRAGE